MKKLEEQVNKNKERATNIRESLGRTLTKNRMDPHGQTDAITIYLNKEYFT